MAAVLGSRDLENDSEDVVFKGLVLEREGAEDLVQQDFENAVEVVEVVEARDDADRFRHKVLLSLLPVLFLCLQV